MTEFVIFPAAIGSAGPPQATNAKKAEREPSSESPFAAVLEKARKKEPDEAEMALAAQAIQAVQPAVLPAAQPAPPEQLSNTAEAPEQAASAETVQDVQDAGSEPAKGCGSSRLETAASGSISPGAASGQSAFTASSQPSAAASAQPAAVAQAAAESLPDRAASHPVIDGQAAAQAPGGVQAKVFEEAMTSAGQLPDPAQDTSGEPPKPAQEAAAVTVSAQASPAPAGDPKSARPKRTAAETPAAAVDGGTLAEGNQEASKPQPASTAASVQPKGNDPQIAVQASKAAAHDRKTQEEGAPGLKNTGASLEAPEMGYSSLQQTQTLEKSSVEPARMAEARSPELVSQISNGIQNLDKSGQTTLRLQLFPENLGRVDLRLTSGAGGLHVTLTADQPLTGTLLERHLPELVQALSDAGVNLAGLEINYGNSGQNPQEAWRWQPAKGMRSAVREPELPAHTSDVYMSRSVSGVDYRV